MPVVLSRPEWSTQVLTIIEKKLLDKRIEVRSKAGTILSGLLHTSFIQEETRNSLKVSNTSNTIHKQTPGYFIFGQKQFRF